MSEAIADGQMSEVLRRLREVCEKQSHVSDNVDHLEVEFAQWRSSMMDFLQTRLASAVADAVAEKIQSEGSPKVSKTVTRVMKTEPKVEEDAFFRPATPSIEDKFQSKENRESDVLCLDADPPDVKDAGEKRGHFDTSILRSASRSELNDVLRETEKAKAAQETLVEQQSPCRNPKKADPSTVNPHLMKVVENRWFNTICAMMIIGSCILVGLATQLSSQGEEPVSVIVLDNLFALWFCFECALRIGAFKWNFIYGFDRQWNLFDSVFVAQSVIDFFLSHTLGDVNAAWFRSIKIIRVFRIFRIFRFLQQLWLLVLMIAESLRSLCWAMIVLCIVLYIFAILLTQLCSDFIKENPDAAIVPQAKLYFGSMGSSFYSLVQAMLDGLSWGVLSDTLFEVGFLPTTLFFSFLTFVMLAVMNVITGVFVDNALSVSKVNRENMVGKEKKLAEALLVQLRDLFHEMDSDGSGAISMEEMKALWEDPAVAAYFSGLGLELSDAVNLFLLIDTGGDGEISVDEFLGGCSAMKGQARNIDMHVVLHEVQGLTRSMRTLMEGVGSLVDFDLPVQMIKKKPALPDKPAPPKNHFTPAAPQTQCSTLTTTARTSDPSPQLGASACPPGTVEETALPPGSPSCDIVQAW